VPFQHEKRRAVEGIAVFGAINRGGKSRVAEQVGQVAEDMGAQGMRAAGVRNVAAQATRQVLIFVFEAHNISSLSDFGEQKKPEKDKS